MAIGFMFSPKSVTIPRYIRLDIIDRVNGFKQKDGTDSRPAIPDGCIDRHLSSDVRSFQTYRMG